MHRDLDDLRRVYCLRRIAQNSYSRDCNSVAQSVTLNVTRLQDTLFRCENWNIGDVCFSSHTYECQRLLKETIQPIRTHGMSVVMTADRRWHDVGQRGSCNTYLCNCHTLQFLPCDCKAYARHCCRDSVCLSVCVSVRPSVCQTRGLWQNEST